MQVLVVTELKRAYEVWGRNKVKAKLTTQGETHGDEDQEINLLPETEREKYMLAVNRGIQICTNINQK